jgi:hypothetical protein
MPRNFSTLRPKAMPGQSRNTMSGARTVRWAVFTAAACPEYPKR